MSEAVEKPAIGQKTRPLWRSLIKLARPHQWAKSVFVLAGPAYNLADLLESSQGSVTSQVFAIASQGLVAAASFALASSGCYVINDLLDAEGDRLHPRKCRRPIASGEVTPRLAIGFALGLFTVAIALIALLPVDVRMWFGVGVGLYIGNVMLYSFVVKHVMIADVMGLSLGFVIRVFGGCAAVGVGPSGWLLNSTFFLAMFLSFGKRLGERRTLGSEAASARRVQSAYTDELLRMMVVVTAVASLVTYSAYTQSQGEHYPRVFNPLWLTVLPATYAMFRCIVLLEQGVHDDPTELAASDRPFQASVVLFGLITLISVLVFRLDAVV